MTTRNRTLRVALGGLVPRGACAVVLALVIGPACNDYGSEPAQPPVCNKTDLTCTDCHGDAQRGDPAPPQDTRGETATTAVTVGAHQAHLGASTWHREIACEECHRVPNAVNDAGHIDGGPAELTWGALATSADASPLWDRTAATCADVYCHGNALVAGGGSNTTPVWTTVDGSQAACGTCHSLPPAAPHTQSTACHNCHGAVVDAQLDFVNPALHINGQVDVAGFACNSCHGNQDNAAPPTDTNGQSATTLVTVGAHQTHLTPVDWHRTVQCNDCHVVPATVDAPGHLDASPAEVTWGGLAEANGAAPSFDRNATTCAGVYCHGTTLVGPNAGGSVARTPEWTTVNDTWDACGTTCHTAPPGGSHPANDQCQICHGNVISSYDSGDPAASTWADGSRHIDGNVDVGGASCTLCHGNATTGDPAPPRGVGGEMNTTDPAVGAHQIHLAASTWHRRVQCGDCHVLPSIQFHDNGVVDFSWAGPSNADGASSAYTAATTTCAGTYCHGTTLLGPSGGGTVNRTPDWTVVDGTYSECGTTCHTLPPGGSHPANNQCETCHGTVISSFNAGNPDASTWTDASRHIDGIVESSGYHDLGGWVSPGGGTDHHGSNYFLRNQQRDEHNADCTQCHGANLDGGTSGVSCDNLGCHGRDWRSCDFCHGTFPGVYNPPAGVAGETAGSATLAVGRHTQHLASSGTHVAFDCDTCHNIPATGDVAHALGYQPSADLSTPGHHGDVTLSGRATNMTWDVAATQGAPVTARGTCTGACHSNGDGGAPAVTPYWAGGTWTSGCGNCHPAQPNTGEHQRHRGAGIGCAECHPGAGATTHVNGTKDYTGVVTPTPNDCAGNTQPTCDGSCHGETHNGDCWN